MGQAWVELQDKIWGMVLSEIGAKFSVGFNIGMCYSLTPQYHL